MVQVGVRAGTIYLEHGLSYGFLRDHIGIKQQKQQKEEMIIFSMYMFQPAVRAGTGRHVISTVGTVYPGHVTPSLDSVSWAAQRAGPELCAKHVSCFYLSLVHI